MRILILGGTGVISTGITQQLIDRGDRVTHFNRATTASAFAGTVEVVKGLRQSRADLEAVAKYNFDAVVDMIGFTAEEARLAIEVFAGHTPHYIFCSTVDVFTAPATHYPIKEDFPRQPTPSFSYAFEKALAEELFEAAASAGAFGLTIMRPAATYAANVVAPLGSTALYLDLARRGRPLIMHGDGSTLWVATHRDDVARGFVGALGNVTALGKSYNLASSEVITWEQYWQTAIEAIGAPTPSFVHIPTDILGRMAPDLAEWCVVNFQYNNVLSNDAARVDLGFNPTITWQTGAQALRQLPVSSPDPALVSRYEAVLDRWLKATASL